MGKLLPGLIIPKKFQPRLIVTDNIICGNRVSVRILNLRLR